MEQYVGRGSHGTSLNVTEREARSLLGVSKSFFHLEIKRRLRPIPWGKRGVRYHRVEIEELAEVGFYSDTETGR